MCEPQKPGLPRAVGVLAAGAAVCGVAVKVLAPVAGALPAVTFTILALCAAGVEVVRRLIKYGRHLRPVRDYRPRRPVRQGATRVAIARRSSNQTAPPVAPRALPPARKTLPAAQLPGKQFTLTRADYEEIPR